VKAVSSRAQQKPMPIEHHYVPGEIVADKYRLIRQLGEGGMGWVWVASNMALDIQVAIKLIKSGRDASAFAERLLREAKTTARLRHPGIVRVFDFGRTRPGDPFIVMELLQGETLGAVLDREHRLSAPQALQLLLPVADGLVAAHAQGIVHRDLKPDNVFIAEVDGRIQPKVLDFGIASSERIREHKRLTVAGTLLGSPDYMAPEQARGQGDIDRRADIWAFCVMLYEAITGSVPFQGDNYNSLLVSIMEAPVTSILDHCAGDEQLWSIMQRALAKDRDARWQTMREFGAALARWLIEHGVTEDAYGHSLRATWLDTGSHSPSGGVISGAPPVSRITPVMRLSPAPASAPAPVSRGEFPTLRPSDGPRPARARWRHPAVWITGLVLLTAAATAITTLALRRPSPQARAAPTPSASPATASRRTAPEPAVIPVRSNEPSHSAAAEPRPVEQIDRGRPDPSAQRQRSGQAASNSEPEKPTHHSGVSASPAAQNRASAPPHDTPSAAPGQAPTDTGRHRSRVYDEDLGF
jgi:serine/threonine protein kinase